MASASSFIEFSRTDQKERLTETVDSVTRSVSCKSSLVLLFW